MEIKNIYIVRNLIFIISNAMFLTMVTMAQSQASMLENTDLLSRDLEYSGLNDCLKGHYESKYEIDICILDTSLRYIHPNVYFHIGEKSYHEEINRLKYKASLIKNDNVYSVGDLSLAIAEFVARIQDSHTYVDLRSFENGRFALPMTLDSEVIKVNGASFTGYKRQDFKILSIDGNKVNDLVEAYAKYFPFSNNIPDKNRTVRNLIAIYKLSNPGKSVTIELENHDKRSLDSILYDLSHSILDYSVADEDVRCSTGIHLELKISSFRTFDADSCIVKSIEKMESVRGNNGYDIMIDLTDNSGGDFDVAKKLSTLIFGLDIFKQEEKARLVTNLTDVRTKLLKAILNIALSKGALKKAELVELEAELSQYNEIKRAAIETSIIKSGYSNIDHIENKKNKISPGYFIVKQDNEMELIVKNNIRKIYIFTNKDTRSTATLFSIYSRKVLGAKLIGEGIGGSEKTFGSSIKIKLPSTELLVYISSTYFLNNVPNKYKDIAWPVNSESAIFLDYYCSECDISQF